MRKSFGILATMLAALGAAVSHVQADPIVIFLDTRATSASAQPLPDEASQRRQDASGGDALSSTITAGTGLNSGTAAATLTSSIADPLHWSGVGTSEVSWTATAHGFYYADATLIAGFQVTTPVEYSFNVDYLLADTGAGTTSTSTAFFITRLFHFLGGVSETVFDFNSQGEDGAFTRSFAGVLAPGTYSLGIGGISSGAGMGTASAATSYSFTMDFSAGDPAPVPEPGSMFLFGTGLVAVAWRRSHRKCR